jgi:hypothetical protein
VLLVELDYKLCMSAGTSSDFCAILYEVCVRCENIAPVAGHCQHLNHSDSVNEYSELIWD